MKLLKGKHKWLFIILLVLMHLITFAIIAIVAKGSPKEAESTQAPKITQALKEMQTPEDGGFELVFDGTGFAPHTAVLTEEEAPAAGTETK